MNSILFIVVVISSIWVYIDARLIGARKGLIKGLFNIGPLGWALCCLLLWIVAFPAYLIKRGEIKAAASNSDVASQDTRGELKQCQFCGEKIQKKAVFCRYCKKDLIETKDNRPVQPDSFTKQVEHVPDQSQREKGLELLKTGNYEEAIDTLTQVIQEASLAEIYYARAVAYSKLNKQKDMISDIKIAAALGSVKAKSALKKMQSK